MRKMKESAKGEDGERKVDRMWQAKRKRNHNQKKKAERERERDMKTD